MAADDAGAAPFGPRITDRASDGSVVALGKGMVGGAVDRGAVVQMPVAMLNGGSSSPTSGSRRWRHRWHAAAMADFTGEDLAGSRFQEVDLSGARFRDVDLTGATLRGVLLQDVDIDGLVDHVRVNGVDVGPLIEAELDRRYPERVKLRATDAEGLREAWAMIERSWQSTVERARRLTPELLHERVDDEWSFVETLRHLVFATDSWVKAALLGDPSPYDRLSLPHTEMPDDPRVPRDLDARPGLDEVLGLRADRMAIVRDAVGGLTDEELDGWTQPNPSAGYPEPKDYSVRGCVQIVLDEEWSHRRYAERDLAVLEARS
jgi:hypothetical protein